jgi:hypothetical protein
MAGFRSADGRGSWLLARPEQHPLAVLITIGVLFAAAYGTSLIVLRKPGGQIVVGDALGHYVQLRSVVFDRDLQFKNEYARLHGVSEEAIEAVSAAERMTPTDHIRNYMPFGPALLWAPLFLVVTAVTWIANLFGAGYPLDGFARAFQATPGFSGIAAACAGSCLAYLTASRLFDRRTAIWATLTVWLSSSTLYYSLVSPTYSHAASMLVVSGFWLAWIATLDRQTIARYAAIGALAGAAALMRWQDAVLLAIPAIEALSRWRTFGPSGSATRMVAATAAAAMAFLPQIAVWIVLYGSPFVIPQGSGFMRWSEPALWPVLFSDNHGLLTWTPILALSLAGLVPLTRRHPAIGTAAIGFIVVTWYVNAAVADWWGGEAFGARRFISCYPVFALGLAALFAELRRPIAVKALAVGFTTYTLLLLLQYQAFMHGLRHVVPYPRGFVDLWLWRVRVPFDLLKWLFER